MTRLMLRPAAGVAAHLYDVYDDDGRLRGHVSHHADTWRYALKKDAPPLLTAPSLPSLRIAMRTHAAQESAR